MKKVLLAGVAGCALFIANAASADVNVLANINKTKDITVTETVTITKTVNLEAVVVSIPGKAAESTGIINQANHNNQDCGNCAEKRDEITNSIGGATSAANHGIVNVNEAAGNMNNQGNAVSVAWDLRNPPSIPVPPPPTPVPPNVNVGTASFANSQAHVDQKNGAYNVTTAPTTTGAEPVTTVVYQPNTVDAVNLLFRDAVITNSIDHNTGIVNVNQAAGNNGNQANNVSVAVSLLSDGTAPEDGGVALSEADLGQVNTGNHAWESDANAVAGDGINLGIHKSATMTGSVSNNVGIVDVNQSAGNMSNQANNVSAAFVVVPTAF
jgi:hypothetical protein